MGAGVLIYGHIASLRSKRFQSSYCAKVAARADLKWKGEEEGRRGNASPQTPWFWKTPLNISQFGSLFCKLTIIIFKIEASITDYQICPLIIKNTLYAIAKTVIKKLYDKRRLKLWAIAAKFPVFNWNVTLLYLIWNLAKTSRRNDLSGTIHSAGYEFSRAAALQPLTKFLHNTCRKISNKQKESFHFKQLTNHLSMVALAIVEYRCFDF